MSEADYTSKKDICGFISVMGLICLIKLVRFLYLIQYMLQNQFSRDISAILIGFEK